MFFNLLYTDCDTDLCFRFRPKSAMHIPFFTFILLHRIILVQLLIPLEVYSVFYHTLHFNGHFSMWTWVSSSSSSSRFVECITRLAGCPFILLLHLFLNFASFCDRPKLSMSFLTQSHQVIFRRLFCLIPSTSHVLSFSFPYSVLHHSSIIFSMQLSLPVVHFG